MYIYAQLHIIFIIHTYICRTFTRNINFHADAQLGMLEKILGVASSSKLNNIINIESKILTDSSTTLTV